jgi:hypothetical protein
MQQELDVFFGNDIYEKFYLGIASMQRTHLAMTINYFWIPCKSNRDYVLRLQSKLAM